MSVSMVVATVRNTLHYGLELVHTWGMESLRWLRSPFCEKRFAWYAEPGDTRFLQGIAPGEFRFEPYVPGKPRTRLQTSVAVLGELWVLHWAQGCQLLALFVFHHLRWLQCSVNFVYLFEPEISICLHLFENIHLSRVALLGKVVGRDCL